MKLYNTVSKLIEQLQKIQKMWFVPMKVKTYVMAAIDVLLIFLSVINKEETASEFVMKHGRSKETGMVANDIANKVNQLFS